MTPTQTALKHGWVKGSIAYSLLQGRGQRWFHCERIKKGYDSLLTRYTLKEVIDIIHDDSGFEGERHDNG